MGVQGMIRVGVDELYPLAAIPGPTPLYLDSPVVVGVAVASLPIAGNLLLAGNRRRDVAITV
jgi:hypothetical protein